ncbi:hypothetical protein GCM10010177_60400 [Actinomadura citrea]|nr:hypothetical protein GCM10010177_60400 [Actinomadura citrea]
MWAVPFICPEVWTHRFREHPARVAAPASEGPGVLLHTTLPYVLDSGFPGPGTYGRVKAAVRLLGGERQP